MDLDSLLAVTCGWLEGAGADADVVVSSRIRLARNLAHYPFLSRADAAERTEIEDVLRRGVMVACGAQHDGDAPAAAEETDAPRAYADLSYIDVEILSSLDRQFLMERQLISRELSEGNGSRSVIIGDRQQTSIMLNEEDHLRLQVLRSGMNLDACWEEINHLDDQIENEVSYAFHEQFGYLTACPTNVGTGIRVSVMLHLPALVQTREIQKVFQAMQKMGIAVRGLYGEGSQAMGDFYQISNQMTLGKSEPEIVEVVTGVVPNIIDYERRVRQALLTENEQGLHDQVSRAYGILRSAQKITSEETLHLLSLLRMGVNLGLIETPPIQLANELMIFTQPAHLQKRLAKELDSGERNRARAEYLRRRLANAAEEN